jgi:hypothetical protein
MLQNMKNEHGAYNVSPSLRVRSGQAVRDGRDAGGVHREQPVDTRRNVDGARRDLQREGRSHLLRNVEGNAALVQVHRVSRDTRSDQRERVIGGCVDRHLDRSPRRESGRVRHRLDGGARRQPASRIEQVGRRQDLKVGVVLKIRKAKQSTSLVTFEARTNTR